MAKISSSSLKPTAVYSSYLEGSQQMRMVSSYRPAVFLRCFRHGGKCPFCSEALQRPLHTFVSSQRTAVTAENILICEVAVYFLLCSPKNKLLVTLTVLLSDMGQMPSVQCQFCRHGHVQELYEWCLLRPFFHVLHQKSKYVASCVCAS